MTRLHLFSPAKVNLYLHVIRRRPDGYHDLETIFERLSLGDRITLAAARSGVRLRTDHRSIPTGPKNLCCRAALLLKETFGVRQGVEIVLKKNIPVSAGLGGGSSNAAAVLVGLNRLWRLGLARKRLLELGAQLGSDVAFFILDVPFAWGTGRGEVLRPIEPPSRLKWWHCVVKPNFGISTREVYEGLDPARLTPPRADAKMLLHSAFRGDPGQLENLLANSLEHTPNKRVAKIFDIKEALKAQGAVAALMSGSGSSVFGIFKSQQAACRAARSLRKHRRSWQVFVASTY